MNEKVEQLKKKVQNKEIKNEKVQYFSDGLSDDEKMLYDICFDASRRTLNNHYKGIAPFFFDQERKLNEVLDELDDIKTLLKALVK